ncbi:MAG: anti-phage defense ZorAB system ZorA, partial [Gammaproteobacteria bacterium]|nr:anti-phage defense ZorAB system ZorA [Gammaproteobacteria bacterium]
TQSIVPLIKGAAVAFSTSVWGTAASVIFNFLEKSIEQAISRRINHLQNRIDNLFVRHLSEQTLVNIERANVEAENALKGLAEQIGERLQEVMHEVPKQIQAGIEASITPAVEKLVEAAETLAAKQGDSAQEGLSALIENFMQGVARSGEESGKRLESASAQLGSSIAAWSEGMDGFLNRLDHRAGEFDTQISGMLEQGRDLRAEAAISQKFLANVAGEMKSGGELLKQATRDLQKFGEDVNQAANLLGEAQTQAAKLTEASARKQQESSQLLSQIAHSLDQANDGLLVSSQSLKDSAEMATASFGNMIATQQEFLEGLKKTLTALRKQTGQMMNDYATDVEEQTKARMQQWNAQTQEFSKGMVAAVNAMSEILGEIDNALAQRQK